MSLIERSLERLKAKGVSAPTNPTDAPDRGIATSDLLAEPWGRPYERLPALSYHSEANHGFSPRDSEHKHLAGQMRTLRRRVLDAVAPQRSAGQAPIVVVTSPLPGDGKSFIAFNLASAFVNDRDISTTLVDADVARHRVSRLFSGEPQGTLSRCIIDGAPLANAVHRTDLSRLLFVPAGEADPRLSDRLASSTWDSLVAEMRGAGSENLFLIDTPPVLATSEAYYLARSADLVLIVVRAERTACSAVSETVARLGDVKNAAFVLNGFQAPFAGEYNDYGSY